MSCLENIQLLTAVYRQLLGGVASGAEVCGKYRDKLFVLLCFYLYQVSVQTDNEGCKKGSDFSPLC